MYMKNQVLLILGLLIVSFAAAQETADFSYSLGNNIFNNQGINEFSIDPASGNIAVLSSNRFTLLGKGGQSIVEQSLVNKVAEEIRFLTTEKDKENNYFNKVFLDEGSGFLVLPSDDVVVVLDWNSTKNVIVAYRISSGEKLWETEDIQYAKSLEQSLMEAAALTAASKLNSVTPLSANIATDFLLYDMQLADRSRYTLSMGAAAFVTPIEGRSEFLIKSGREQVLIDALTGQEKWRFSDFNMIVAFSKYLPDRDEVFLVHNNPALLGKNANKLVTVLLDMASGEERLRIVPEGAFSNDQVRIIDEKLVLGLKGLEVYSLEDGQRILNTLGWKDQKAQKSSAFGQFLASQQSATPAPTSFIGSQYEDSFVYTGYLVDITGTYKNPLSPGITTKATLAKYNIQGMIPDPEPIWKRKVTGYLGNVIQLENELIAARIPNIGKESWFIVDKGSGKVKKELKFKSGGAYIAPLFQDNLIFQAFKRSVAIVDQQTWKIIKEVDLKKLNIGRCYFMREAGDQIAIVGKEGVSWMNADGSIDHTVTIKNAKGIQIDEEVAIMYDARTAYLISLKDQQIREIEKGSPLVGDTRLMYSPEARRVLRIAGRTLYGYNF